MKIVVLAGGLSPERDVSLSSGSLIANALMERGHEVLLLDLYCGLEINVPYGELFLDTASNHKFEYAVPEQEPDLSALRERCGNGDSLIGKNVLELCRFADLVFLSLHGSIGENGALQGLFDVYGIAYTGTGYAGSLLAMDKDLTKRLLVGEGIPTPAWTLVGKGEDFNEKAAVVGFPCVVKPCGCGSSIGISMAENERELQTAMEAAFRYEDAVLIEKRIFGREFSVGILDGRVLPPIEIIPKEGFYDYKNKYQAGLTEEICPALLSGEQTMRIQEQALKIHHTLRLGSYSRIDFLMDSKGEFTCLEANTLPGMTPTSLLPQEAAAAGIPYPVLCEQIALSALGEMES